jgi:hypothetical protein
MILRAQSMQNRPFDYGKNVQAYKKGINKCPSTIMKPQCFNELKIEDGIVR